MASFASTAAATVAPGGCVAGARRGGRCAVRASAALAVAAPASARTHYEVLGVGAGASRVEIKAAYRRLAREVHPDAAGGSGGAAGGDEDFIRLHAAYATLADPDERARYDRAMAPAAAAFRMAPASFRRRTWETDQCW
ncbi:chaperone protein dnaJ 11, chloroplastic-like [Oryza brachyantha]|uniref:chaperone protein dnaJ 11, chloroplastic-like n=1 Tax=Oryza brachyantha TaxID=4533 RepID=UPI001ADD52BF|nr:chaperone protein dnaJ 11, chloroplastic-like [Oryza brachyantha]